ncbi:MAG: hypothetical protein UZ02_AOB001001899, partial [Nitrosomonas europaea]
QVLRCIGARQVGDLGSGILLPERDSGFCPLSQTELGAQFDAGID